MKIQLHSIEQAPSYVPIWPLLMDDLCQPPADRVARILGISARTVRRYNRTGQAPRAICLAVFWLTSWGRNAIHTQAHNDAELAVSYVQALSSRIRELEDAVRHLQVLNATGAANDPIAQLSYLAQAVAPAIHPRRLSLRQRRKPKP